MDGSRWALAALVSLHVAALAGDLVAPYSPQEQRREFAYSPPTRLHMIDAAGAWHAVPFVYRVEWRGGRFLEDERRRFPLRFLVRGSAWTFVGVLPADRHVVGVDAPATLFLLGTDRYGRDLFSRLVVGARLSLFAGLLATLLAVGLGTCAGAACGFVGGRVDACLSWLAAVCLCVPWIYVLLAARSLLPLDLDPGAAFLATALLIGLVAWGRPAVLARSVVRVERDRDYVVAARSCGASTFRLLVRHVAPQAAGVVLTQAALLVPRAVLAEMTLSFLGLGVSEPAASWGTLAAAMVPPASVVAHWWLATPLVAIAALFALYDRVARDLEHLPSTSHVPAVIPGKAG